jgi:hypothetical protein
MTPAITQTILPFKLEESDSEMRLTSRAGLPLVHEMMKKLGVPGLIRQEVRVKEKGWREDLLVESIVGLVVSGGEHLSDIEELRADSAYQTLLEVEDSGLPGAKALERFLKRFHDEEEMAKRPVSKDEKAWVPEESEALQGLGKVTRGIARKLIKKSGLKVVTIENDATAVFNDKDAALGTYKGGTGYMPVIGSIAELGIVIAEEFRDGNVPPAFEVKRFFQTCEKAIPNGVTVRARLDGAYYDHDFIAYLKKKKIDFTITGKKSESILEWITALPNAAWKPLMKMTANGPMPTGKQWAEMPWTSAQGSKKSMRSRMLRTLVTRKSEEQWELFQDNAHEAVKTADRYEVIVTSMDWQGDRLILWHYERGGSIEHTHDRIKNDLAGGKLPSGDFGANAAWWRLNCLAWNIVRAIQLYAELPEDLARCHLKRLRFRLFSIAGKVIRHARQVILKLAQGCSAFPIYHQARLAIAAMAFP